MRLLAGLWIAGCALAAAPSPEDVLRSVPLRFEQDARGRWGARGVGYALRFEARGAYLHVGDRTLRLSFAGSNAKARFEALEPQGAQTNYFIGREFRSTRAFAKLRRSQVYPGVDVVYYGSADHLEYDFDLAPGADASRIRLRFEGADQVSVNERGDLALKLGDGEVIQRAAVVYQRKASGEVVAVESRYRLEEDGMIGVSLGDYDRGQSLVIDPILYTAYLSGTNADAATTIAVDPKGLVYLAGYTYSDDFPASGNGYSVLPFSGVRDGWIIQMNPFSSDPNNVILYSTFFGGNLDTDLRTLAVDASGKVYIAGTTLASNFPVTSGAFQSQLANTNAQNEGFVSVLDTTQQGSGSLIYSSYYSGSQVQQINGIATQDGKFYITGWTNSDDLPLTGGAFQSTRGGGYDAFVAAFDPGQSGTASLVYASYLGGYLTDQGNGIAVDANGLIYVTGSTQSTEATFPTTSNAYAPTPLGNGDAFLTVIDPSANVVVYSTFLGGSGIDIGTNIVLGPAGQVSVAGYTFSTDLPVTPNASQPVLGGNSDAFVITLNPAAASRAAELIYATYYGGSEGEVTYGFSRDPGGRYYLCGYTLSPNLPVSSTAAYPTSLGNNVDGFLAVIDPSRALIYGSYITGPGLQVAYGVATDRAGNAYVAGQTSSDVFPRGGAQHQNPPGNIDAFFLVVAPSANTAQNIPARVDYFRGKLPPEPLPSRAPHRFSKR